MAQNSVLEGIYHDHHSKRRGNFFLVNGEARGGFLRAHVGTGKRVLDIGCRDGALTKFYAADNDVTGLDIDSVALARAHESIGIRTIQADLNGEWPLEPGFDVVVACEIIEHLYYPEVVAKKIYLILKPGSVLLGSIPHAFSLQNRLRFLFGSKKNTPLEDPTHINHFTVAEFRSILQKAGFRDIHIEAIVSDKFKLFSFIFPYLFAHSLLFSARKK